MGEPEVIGQPRRCLNAEARLVAATLGKLTLVIAVVMALRFLLLLAQSDLH